MFVYKQDGEKVIGRWKDNFLIRDGQKHPMESRVGLLVPLAVREFSLE
jgi:hypothetical protein